MYCPPGEGFSTALCSRVARLWQWLPALTPLQPHRHRGRSGRCRCGCCMFPAAQSTARAGIRQGFASIPGRAGQFRAGCRRPACGRIARVDASLTMFTMKRPSAWRFRRMSSAGVVTQHPVAPLGVSAHRLRGPNPARAVAAGQQCAVGLSPIAGAGECPASSSAHSGQRGR